MMQNGNAQNVTEPDFRKKNFLGKFGQKLPKNRFFWTLCKIASLNFFDFLHKCSGQGPLKSDRNSFFQKNFFGCKNEFLAIRNTIFKHTPMFLT